MDRQRAHSKRRLAAVGVLVACSAYGAQTAVSALRSAAAASPPQRAAQAPASATTHYEYVFVDGAVYVYDIDHGMALVRRLQLPGITSIKGVGADLSNHMLYISHGGDGGGNGNGSLAAYDLLTNLIVWDHPYSRGIDSFAISRDGSRIFMPDGELSTDGVWSVLDASNGNVLGTINAGGSGPHNTIVGATGRDVYLGPRDDNYLIVASTATDQVVRRVGPLYSGVRPFTINGHETVAYTTATGLLGFQVSSLVTGRVLYTVNLASRFSYPAGWPLTAPSHGIALSADERQLWVIDTPNADVHLFDVSGVPSRAPRLIKTVRLSQTFAGQQADCSLDCERDGWLQTSVSGCYLFVGDTGDVISTASMRRVAYLPALRNSREMLEIDWRGGRPTATSTRSGLGHWTGRGRPTAPRCA
jgi:DNA-binding beta-propeller fold protein YncE